MSAEYHHSNSSHEIEAEDNELMKALENIWDIALENHLDPFPTNFEIAPANVVYQIGAYGIPGKFSHWTHGRAYRQMMAGYNHGQSKIYELVINSNPSQAYLLENNLPIDNKFIMAHVLGHTDFFKNNMMFASTRRDMPEAAAKSAARIRSYEEQEGFLTVEKTLDAVMALEEHIDPYAPLRPSRDEELRKWQADLEYENRPIKQTIGEFDDLLPPAPTVERNLGRRALHMPPKPDQDILGFIRNHAPYLEDWQRDVVDIVRDHSLYFYPQRRTKIMNEGWAAFWHKRIMREMSERGEITPAENEAWWKLHSGVVAPNPRQLNPYYLGMKMFEYIEDYYNGQLTDKETDYLEREGITTYPRYDGPLKDSPAMPHLRDAMMYNDDQSFIRNHFNKIIADRMEMYIFEEVPTGTGEVKRVVSDNSWEKIRYMLTRQMENNGQPLISVTDGDYNHAGELYLYHESDGRILDQKYVGKTLPYLHNLWGRTVHLETKDTDGKTVVYNYDGKAISQR